MPGCAAGPAGRATLVRLASHFSFAPADGVLVIAGEVGADGSFAGTLVTAPARHDQPGSSSPAAAPFTLSVSGRLDAEAATGSYITPRCTVAFRLPRIPASILP